MVHYRAPNRLVRARHKLTTSSQCYGTRNPQRQDDPISKRVEVASLCKQQEAPREARVSAPRRRRGRSGARLSGARVSAPPRDI